MNTVDKLLAATAEIWKSYNEHPFVLGIQNGTLAKEKFRYYMIQDYLYLEDYAKTFAVGVAKAKSLRIANLFAKYIPVMNGELNVHDGYLARLGVTQEEINSTPRSLAVAKDEANKFGVDINKLVVIDGVEHDVGAQVLNAWIFNSENCIPNNVAGNLGLTLTWEHTIAKGLMGVEGMPAYEVAIEARKSLFDDVLAETAAILGTDELNDNQAPAITVTGKAVVATGADLAATDWTAFFSAEDGFDGVMDPAMAAYDLTGVDVATAGSYKVKATFTDKSGNAGTAEVEVIVYDAANTTEPTLVLVEEVPAIVMDTDSTTIDWTAYVAEAKDASGLDLKANITVDDSALDTSMPDVYTVTLTVTDYAGNTASADVEVEVVVE